MSTEIATRQDQAVSGFEMKPRTLDEAMRFCEIMSDSDLVPNGYKGKPGNIMVAIQMGQELGMTPMRALRSIAVINGRATMWGDDMLAMVLASPVCESIDESESTDTKGVCKAKRKGSPEHVSTFTLEDAKRAGLLGKQGPWQQHTGRMLKLRARGFALRDKFADVLAGLVTAEEAYDLLVEQPAVSVVEPEQPLTLKDKLKAKVEVLEQPADTAAGEGGTARQDGGDGSVGSPAPQHHQEGPDAAAPSIFEQSQAVADWSAVIADTNDVPGLQKHWETITKDARLDSTQKVDLFKVYQKRVKDVGKKR